jgi:CheY-like chemotaxis protein
MMEEAGFEEEASADEAIAILERRLDITVVFTDIQMPGSMDGIKLAAAVRDRWPPIKIVATSGHVNLVPGICHMAGVFCRSPTAVHYEDTG